MIKDVLAHPAVTPLVRPWHLYIEQRILIKVSSEYVAHAFLSARLFHSVN